MKQLDLLYIAGESVKWYSHSGKHAAPYKVKTYIYFPYDPAISEEVWIYFT